MSIYAVMIVAGLVQNVILVRYLGFWPLISIVYSPRRSIIFSCAVLAALLWVSLLYSVVHRFFLLPFQLLYLETLTLVMILAVSVLVCNYCAILLLPRYKYLAERYIRAVFVNTTVFVVVMSLARNMEQFWHIPLAAVSAGMGGGIALVLIASVQERIRYTHVPRKLKKDTIIYIAIGVIALVIQQIDSLFHTVQYTLW